MRPDQSGNGCGEEDQEYENGRPIIGPEPLIHFPSVVNLGSSEQTLEQLRVQQTRLPDFKDENPFNHTCRLFAVALSNLHSSNSLTSLLLVFRFWLQLPGKTISSRGTERET
jgi:hypothetical protein